MNPKKTTKLIGLLATLSFAILLSGCGPQQSAQAPVNNTPSANPNQINVMIGDNPSLGKILTDGKGMTLYTYTKDAKDSSTCYDTCATNWPPLLVTDSPKIATNLVASNFGVITRTNGDKQLTFKGMPLYYWIKDIKAGDATGQGIGGIWFVYKISLSDTNTNPTPNIIK